MPISVVCPGCQKRFNVSDKFAGKKGPCPKCKAIIKIPEKTEEVVIHAPDNFGPKDATGRAVLKPIPRTEVRFSPVLAGTVMVASLAVLITAWLLRSPQGDVSWLVLTLGAVVLAPPLVWAGYTFLRDDELEPHRGRGLLLRAVICGGAYAVVWGLVAVLTQYVFQGDPLELIHFVFIVPIMIGLGGFAAWASLDLDFGTGTLHYGLYLVVTVALRLILGLSAV